MQRFEKNNKLLLDHQTIVLRIKSLVFVKIRMNEGAG